MLGMRLWGLTGREQDQNGPVEYRGERDVIKTDKAASKMLDDILHWLMDHADDANEETGEASVAMVRRAFEMVAKISFILAIPDGARTVDHVRWAFAYFRADLNAKVALVFANDHEKTRPEEAVAARIIARLDPEKGKTLSVLANALRLPREQIQGVLISLEAKGVVKKAPTLRRYRGEPVVAWVPVAA